jgi:adenine-specific DNA-methyltransferase
MSKQNLGQYFTSNTMLKEKVLEFIKNSPDNILEPCIGRGDLISFIKQQDSTISFDMYEIDNTIQLLDDIAKQDVVYGDFLKQTITKKYITIVGNPPYVRTKKKSLYIDFISKCYHLLDDYGELIFIVPSDFLKLTSASKLLNEMLENGSFTDIFNSNDENMFENASIDIIVFRYCKNNSLEKVVMYNDKLLYITNNNGLITFSEDKKGNSLSFGDCFHIYVGFVSGNEEVYKNEELGSMPLLNGKNKVEKYICITSFPCNNQATNEHLLKHKEELITRKIRKFNENNWFEWGAMRNVSSILQHIDKDCIYISNLTRNPTVAFIDKVQYFGGSLIMLVPKRVCNLSLVVAYLNSDEFKDNFMFSGRFKIGHRGISNSFIPSEYL